MSSPSQGTVTRLLRELQGGNQAVLDQLFSLVYQELHDRARWQRQRWQGDYTLNTTALVNEAYLKLVKQSRAGWENRAHFLAVAAKAMRHILIDYARRKPEVVMVPLQEMLLEDLGLSEERAETLLALDEALKALEQVNAREARVVECRFFGGMTVKETAAALGISDRTVKRDWAMARTWLYHAMQKEGDS